MCCKAAARCQGSSIKPAVHLCASIRLKHGFGAVDLSLVVKYMKTLETGSPSLVLYYSAAQAAGPTSFAAAQKMVRTWVSWL